MQQRQVEGALDGKEAPDGVGRGQDVGRRGDGAAGGGASAVGGVDREDGEHTILVGAGVKAGIGGKGQSEAKDD